MSPYFIYNLVAITLLGTIFYYILQEPLIAAPKPPSPAPTTAPPNPPDSPPFNAPVIAPPATACAQPWLGEFACCLTALGEAG
ncbi:hypothetical protein AK966_08405 [Vibrio sp. PID23_8]|nr:hypothetical protein AK966_08405 [Vibrio sp. PID23_8]